jgi:predicted glutamine amidotransferase
VIAHNGTILDYEKLEISEKYESSINSDTERLLYHFISNMEKSGSVSIEAIIKTSIANVPEYTGINLLLFTKQGFIATRNYQVYPNYLSFKYLSTPNSIIVASEEVPDIEGNWISLQNHQILSASFENPTHYSLC